MAARQGYPRREGTSLGNSTQGWTGWWYTYPSEKYEFVSWDDDIPNIWKNKKCSKPPTSNINDNHGRIRINWVNQNITGI
jgi:hypothetical protein